MDTTRLGQIIQWRTVPQTVLRLWKNGSRHHLHHRLEFRGGLPAGSWGPSWTWLYASLSKGHREANIRATNPPLPPELKWWTGALQWSASASLTLSPVPQSSLTPTPWLMASCRGRRYQCRGRERRGEDHGHRWHREHTRRYGGGQRNWRTSGDEGLAGRFVPRAAKSPQRKTSPSSTLSGRHCLYPGDRLSPEALDQPKPLSLIPGTISYAWLTLCSDIQ